MSRRALFSLTCLALAIPLAGLSIQATSPRARAGCDADNGGLTLPAGFCASVFADDLGRARHLAVAPNGDVFVNTWSSRYTENKNAPGGYLVALRDTNNDGKADQNERFGPVHTDGAAGGRTGIAVHGGFLYVEDLGKIVRYRLANGTLAPKANAEIILTGLQTEAGHIMHPFVIASDGTMYVNSGSRTNSCQETDRTLESPGLKPCTELELHGGIWRYDANKTTQAFAAKERFATGTRNAVALALDSAGTLFATLHGRDGLGPHWPKLYTTEQNNELPAEILVRIDRGADFGWPECYYDPKQRKHVLAPEYGGDGGKAVGPCAQKTPPLLAFPAHWAPNAMTFYNGSAFPAKYRGGAFVAFHGSHDRKPVQAGYLVAFVPFASSKPSGAYEQFATGFTGAPNVKAPPEARHRPMGVATGPDGALYVSDDVKGRIWKITYGR